MAGKKKNLELTPKNKEILEFITGQIQKQGYPPTVREICAAVNLRSTATVYSHINKLAEMGYLEKNAGKNRSLTLKSQTVSKSISESDDKYLEVPVVGKITAGEPITAVEDISETFPLPMDFAKNKELFMLRVRGESMINAAILDGDMIIVQRQSSANNGDIVAALINGEEATVKTFYKEDGHFRLQPENDTMEPIILDEVSILGKVVGVFRKI